ncbi:MAG: ribosome maturation factor RimP [Acidimicrobiia bacterium]
MTATDELGAELRARLEPVVATLGLALFDVELTGSGRARTVRVLVDRDGGIDLDAIADATRAISPLLDEAPGLDGAFTLEVSSPGLERPLRRPEHFAAAIGTEVSVRYRTLAGSIDRVRGVLVAADGTSCTVRVDGDETQIPYDQLAQARTVFEWGPAPRPGKAGPSGTKSSRTKVHR